jgi:hypothetical protein
MSPANVAACEALDEICGTHDDRDLPQLWCGSFRDHLAHAHFAGDRVRGERFWCCGVNGGQVAEHEARA